MTRVFYELDLWNESKPPVHNKSLWMIAQQNIAARFVVHVLDNGVMWNKDLSILIVMIHDRRDAIDN